MSGRGEEFRRLVCRCTTCKARQEARTSLERAAWISILRRGDQLSNEQLVGLIEFLTPLDRMSQMGDLFLLPWIQINHWLDTLHDYAEARLMNGHGDPRCPATSK